MSRWRHPSWLPWIVCACVLAVACGDDDEASSSSGGSSGDGADEQQVVTEDGYEVVLASDRQRRGPEPSEPGERAEERDEDNLVREPTEPDPHGGELTLEEAVEGMPIDGDLVAEMTTDLGTIFCELHAERTPTTVANFIGLARGKRAWWDPRDPRFLHPGGRRVERRHG